MSGYVDFHGVFNAFGEICEDVQNKPNEIYLNKNDGLYYCKKCNTPRQYVFDNTVEQLNGKVVWCACECKIREHEEIKAREKQEKLRQALKDRKAESLMDVKFFSSTFDNFRTTNENIKIKQACQRYCENFKQALSENIGMMFWGECGTGKTYAASCIANFLIEKGYSVLVTNLVHIISVMQSFNNFKIEELMNKIRSFSLIILDDLGAERTSDFAVEQIYNVIDTRYRSEKPMIITTNLIPSELWKVEDLRYKRLYDRIHEVCPPFEFKGENLRNAESQNKRKEFVRLLNEA